MLAMIVFYMSLLFLIFCCLVYFYLLRRFKYWENRHVPGPRPIQFFGNFKDFVLRKSTAGTCTKQIYDNYPNEMVVGFYRMTRRSLLIRDLDVIKNVLIKDFECFEDRGIQYSETELGCNIFHADAEIWRPVRRIFSRMFTTSKLKNMTPLINDSDKLIIEHVYNITVNQMEQDIYKLMKKFTISSILVCFFGLNINADIGPLSEKFSEIDRSVFSRNIAEELDFLYPGILRKINGSLFYKGLNGFFVQLIDGLSKARNGVPSYINDFVDIVLELQNENNVLKTEKAKEANSETGFVKLSKETVAAQAFIFYVAGYQTNTIILTFILYELAINPSIQEKLIAEVDEVLKRHDGQITYEMIKELSYMEKVTKEALRKYPVSDLLRVAKANYHIKGTNITIEKGITIVVPLLGIHRDEKYYPNPDIFDPERFSPDNERKRHSCEYIPFGTGPRHCIGKLFARIQSRVCLIHFLSNFRVDVSKNTPRTIQFDPQHIINAPKEELYLNILPRKCKTML